MNRIPALMDVARGAACNGYIIKPNAPQKFARHMPAILAESLDESPCSSSSPHSDAYKNDVNILVVGDHPASLRLLPAHWKRKDLSLRK